MRPDTVRWVRSGEDAADYDMKGRTKTEKGDPGTNDTSVGVLLLTVLNSTAADSGHFACVADNGVAGEVAVNETVLLVRRKHFMRNNFHCSAEERCPSFFWGDCRKECNRSIFFNLLSLYQFSSLVNDPSSFSANAKPLSSLFAP